MNESVHNLQPGSAWRQISTRRAFLSHLALSAAVVGMVSALIFLVWYPDPYFTIKGAWDVLRVLVGVDLVLGPLLTLILFRPNKPGLALDVTMIALIQLAALIYGTSVIYQQRPYYAVFAVDRFEILARGDVERSAIAGTPFERKPAAGPVLAYAPTPTDVAEAQRLLQETVFEGKPDIERRPEFWKPFDTNKEAVLARARPLAELEGLSTATTEDLARRAESQGHEPSSLVFVPVIGTRGAMTMILDPSTALPIAAVPIDPWTMAPTS